MLKHIYFVQKQYFLTQEILSNLTSVKPYFLIVLILQIYVNVLKMCAVSYVTNDGCKLVSYMC